MSLRFYIVKRDEREGDGYAREVEFNDHHELENYLQYNRAYITDMQTIGLKTDSNACKECGVSLTSEGVTDGIPLCHPCYVKLNEHCTDCNQPPHLCTCAPMCGDCLRPLNVCEHQDLLLKTGVKK